MMACEGRLRYRLVEILAVRREFFAWRNIRWISSKKPLIRSNFCRIIIAIIFRSINSVEIWLLLFVERGDSHTRAK